MSVLRFTVKMRIRAGKEKAFRDVFSQMQKLVRQNEPGALAYDFYIASNGIDALAHEHYQSSEAFLAHLGNVGHLFGPLGETAEFGETVIAGAPQEKIRAMFGEGTPHPALFYTPL